MVREFQRVIGREARAQLLSRIGRLPDVVVACVGGGSNAIGIFSDFLADPSVRLLGVEPAGRGLDTGRHGATLLRGRPGVLHGAYSMVLQDAEGQIQESHTISAGLDYPGVGPEHACLRDIGRAQYVACTDQEALAGFRLLAETEGILPALESAHALAVAHRLARESEGGLDILVNLSGRGDKDLETVLSHLSPEGGLA
jgi:tryptophan synthase beta chain